MMELAAQLGAGDLVSSFARSGEMNVDPHPRHGVLLQSQRGDVKIVDHVFRPEREAYRAVDGRDQRSRHYVVLASRVGRVDAEWPGTRADRVVGVVVKPRVRAPELPVGAGVAEIPEELLRDGLDMHGVRKRYWRRLIQSQPRPDSLAGDCQGDENDAGNRGQNYLDTRVAR